MCEANGGRSVVISDKYLIKSILAIKKATGMSLSGIVAALAREGLKNKKFYCKNYENYVLNVINNHKQGGKKMQTLCGKTGTGREAAGIKGMIGECAS